MKTDISKSLSLYCHEIIMTDKIGQLHLHLVGVRQDRRSGVSHVKKWNIIAINVQIKNQNRQLELTLYTIKGRESSLAADQSAVKGLYN